MKIIIARKETGSSALGWDIVAESTDDKLILGTMRNMLFFGLSERVVEYDGQTSDPNDESYVMKLHFRTREQKAKAHDEWREAIEAKRKADKEEHDVTAQENIDMG